MFTFNRFADIHRDPVSEGNTQLVYIEGESAEIVFPCRFSHDVIIIIEEYDATP